jgi:hypothetical protein
MGFTIRDWLFLVHPQEPQSVRLFGLTPSPQAIRAVVATTGPVWLLRAHQTKGFL